MNPPNERPRGKLIEGSISSNDEITILKEQVQNMQLEIDILKETINIFKKDPGINLNVLSNKEKAVIVDALKEKYSLPLLLKKLHFSKSSYYYQASRKTFSERHTDDLKHIKAIFNENKARYRYRRIRAILNREGINMSEKVVRKIMRDNSLFVKTKKARKYNSYKGEISPEVPNFINGNFSAEKPNEKWLTDITEFSIPAGKVYLSPIIDCFDGMPVSWKISTTPDAELVNSMLDEAIATLNDGEHPVVHSDRGCHYIWPGWIERMEKAHLYRSMSKKGCSPDNAACEGFFWQMKNEMFYCRFWVNVTIEEFIKQIDEYIHWYCNKHIKMSLGILNPIEYRKSLGVGV